ncbi:MAG TPA: DUF4252 domain-containing protein [Candidatus Acidoferrales bacterium]|nr:DUF4252 domain-containing protein [Candidatus Acidoferrales bacterium]
MKIAVLGCALAAALFAQQFKFNLDHLAPKASEKVDLSLSADLLHFAANFLDTGDPDEAKVKKLVGGLQGIYVKSFEFKKEGQYTKGDLDQIRNQLKAPEWQRMMGFESSEDRETVEVWVRSENGKMTGLALLATEATSLTVANIVGSIELSSLSELGGHLGIPKLKKK